ncbi:MAG: glycine zipper 2TM domain-containing protein [Cardiobacteriaceae bacterium]|nr:glycine zipper 2TM domain-containing protein [Cardiobacteriaceae bacterium]
MKKLALSSTICFTFVLTGCVAGGDVYDADDINTTQGSRTVQILNVSPAKIKQNSNEAKAIGTGIGAVVGGLLGNKMSGVDSKLSGTVVGAGVGGVGGYAGGAIASSTTVDGVTITYQEGSQLLSTTQVGKTCQFKEGTALMVITQKGETRIQPNATCTAR